MSLPENLTRAIWLGESWTNTSLSMTATLRPADFPIMDFEVLFSNGSTNMFYAFGGAKDDAALYTPGALQPEALWSYSFNNEGIGNWTQVLGSKAQQPFPPDVAAGFKGITFSNSESMFQYASTVGSNLTTSKSGYRSSGITTAGLLQYSFSDNTLVNRTDLDDFIPSDQAYFASVSPPGGGSSYAGISMTVPIFGEAGVGISVSGGTSQNVVNGFAVSWEVATIFDMKSQRLFYQDTTGSSPPDAFTPCVAGAADMSGRNFEM